jgi:YD repeat-containing protein
MMSRCVVRFFALPVLLMVGSVLSAQSQTVRYVYDELGRLTAAIDQNGDAAVYQYDAVGNLLSIARHSSGSVAIVEFTPNAAPVGTAVTLYGIGFSATPSQNTVTFNGTAASVTSSTVTSITTAVPSGATTGTIAVTTPLGSASSSSGFQVTSSTNTPTVSSFTPAIGVIGTSVTISGTNFETVMANNRLTLNATRAVTTTGSSTSLTTTVPIKTASGRLNVTTPSGSATSTADFFIAPPPFVASDVQYTGRTTAGTAGSVAITTAAKIGLLAFDATAGQRISVKLTPGPISIVSLYRPDAVLASSASVGVLTTLIEPQAVPQTGTYVILVDPLGTTIGTTTVTPYSIPADVSGSILTDGTAVGITIGSSEPGRNAELTYSGTSGHRMSLAVSSGVGANVSLLNPNGSTLASAVSGPVSTFIDPATLGSTATHKVRVDPQGANTGSLTVNLYDVPADVTGTLTINDTATSLSLGTPGQNAVYTFSGTASQQVTVRITDNLIGTVTVKLQKADGTVLKSSTSVLQAFNLATHTLPTTDTYTVLIDPSKAGSGTIKVRVTNP